MRQSRPAGSADAYPTQRRPAAYGVQTSGFLALISSCLNGSHIVFYILHCVSSVTDFLLAPCIAPYSVLLSWSQKLAVTQLRPTGKTGGWQLTCEWTPVARHHGTFDALVRFATPDLCFFPFFSLFFPFFFFSVCAENILPT